MAAYYINGKNFTSYDILAGRAPDSSLAISGAWSMPMRTGKIYHEWPDENGVEPYLRKDELFYDGRDITFHGYVKGTSRTDAMGKVHAFYEELDLLSGGLFPLMCEWGNWDVQVLQPIIAGYVSQGFCKVEIPFREPVVNLTGNIPASTNAALGIDGISFKDLGLAKVLTSGNFNRQQSNQTEFTAYGFEGHSIAKRGLREFGIKFFIKQNTYEQFNRVIKGLFALFSKPGARTLKLDDGTVREVFIKDGFTVNGVRKNKDMTFGFIEIHFAEIRMLESWNLLTDNAGLVLVDKYSQPLTQILKGF